MDECGDYSIRGDVANIRERDPMMNYPFILPQGLTEEQIRSLLPLLSTSRKCKRWDCLLCVKQFIEQDCPHDPQPIEAAAAPSVNRSIVEKIDAVEVLICTKGSENVEVECITNKQQFDNSEPKVFFDLNVPIVELYDEALENSNNHAPATEELAVAYNPECSTSEPVSVDKQQTKNLEAPEPEASAQVSNNGGIGNSENVSPPLPPEILVPSGKKALLRIKKARKYHSISFLNQECERESSQNAPSSNPQSNKTELKNKKKMQQCRKEQGAAGTKISEATENGSEQNRTTDCNLPLKQNFVLANVSLSPRRESSGKRKHQVNHDQNGAIVASKSSEDGHHNESSSVDIQLRKRRIFCSVTKTPLADADQSQRVDLVGHKSKKNRPSRKQSLIIPVAELGNSHPTRIEKGKSKAAYQLMLRRKLKNINGGEPSGTARDKATPEKSSPVVVGKELVLKDKPISTIEKDVQMPCLQDDNFNLKQLKSEIIKTLKRHKFDPPYADNNKNQNVIRNGENGTSLLTHSEKSVGNGKGDANLMLGAPQEKKKEIDHKSSPNVLKTRGRLKKVPKGCPSSSGSKKKQDDDKQAASVGKDITTILRSSTILPSEAALQLLSMVAVDTLENGASFLPIMEEFHVPPITSVLEMGYEGCIEVTNPADYLLVDGEGDRFKLGPEDLPLRPHRLLPPKCLPIAIPTSAAGTRLAAPEE